MIDLNRAGKPDIVYPCDWNYKIIGDDVSKIVEAVKYAVDNLSYELSPSNVSKKGNYFSMNLRVSVPSEDKRNEIYSTLENDKSVKYIL